MNVSAPADGVTNVFSIAYAAMNRRSRRAALDAAFSIAYAAMNGKRSKICNSSSFSIAYAAMNEHCV